MSIEHSGNWKDSVQVISRGYISQDTLGLIPMASGETKPVIICNFFSPYHKQIWKIVDFRV